MTVALLNQSDSSVYKGILTTEKGTFCFENIKKGKFILKISGVGYSDQYSAPISYDSSAAVTVPDITVGKSGVSLDEVSVSAIKNPIEFKGGNIIVNVEDSPLAVGNNAYELITKLPGVMVEGDNISLMGKGGVKVFIDDRILQMSGAQLISFLRGLNASSIEKIEIINNPPARYDAAGNAGIINIKTKKIKVTGFSGNLNYTFSQGFYTTNNGGFSLNYKGRKFSFFSNVGGYEGMYRHETTDKRTIRFNGASTTLDQNVHEIDAASFLTANLGADWYLNKKNTIGVKAQLIPGHAVRTLNGDIAVSDTTLGYDRLAFNRPVENTWFLANYNLNAEHLFDTLGTRLRFSADYYTPNYDIYDGFNQNYFYSTEGLEAQAPQIFRTSNTIGITVIAARLDFEKKIGKSMRIETGIKQNYQKIFSDYSLEHRNSFTGEYTLDSTFSNKFRYNESISAAYVTLEKDFKKWHVQAGLRAENTDVRTASLTNNINYTRQYFNVFPVLSADYNPSQDHSMSVSYNRRINRPNYNSYNPFRSFLNILNSSEGNPFLLPTYDNNFNFSYIFKRKISNFISFGHVENPVYFYSTQIDSTKETIMHGINIKYANIVRYNLFVRQEVKKWWTVSFLAGAYYVDYRGTFDGIAYYRNAVPWYTRLTFLFLLKKDTKIEMSGFYWSPWLGGTSTMLSRGGVSWSVKKGFLNNTLQLSIGVNDLFFTEQFRSKSDFQGQDWERSDAHDSRRFNVSLNYNFGKIKAEQRHTKENDEEKRRLGR
jgi:outer membrane receptor protein involved in Fe transport